MNPSELEQRKIRQIRREYEQRGYQVLAEPQSFPGLGSAAFVPDLVAVNGEETVLIEIVSSSSRPEAGDRIRHLSVLAQETPTWRFELINTNPRSGDSWYPSLSERPRWLARVGIARMLFDPEDPTPAIVVLWTAVEPAMRYLYGEERPQQHSPLALLKAAYSQGLLNFQDLRALEDLATARNRSAHGERLQVPRKRFEGWARLAGQVIERTSTASPSH